MIPPEGSFRSSPSELAAEAGKIGQQRRGLDQTAPQRVGHGHVPGPHSLDQARDSEERVAAELQRIAIIVVEPAEDHVHRLKPAQQLEINAIVADRQIAPFHQRVAEIAGEEGVLEVGLVVRPRRQQHDARVVAIVRGDRL